MIICTLSPERTDFFLEYFTVSVGGRLPRTTEDIRDNEHVQCQPGVLFPPPHPDLDFGSPGLANAMAFWQWLANYNMYFLSSYNFSGKQIS